MQPLFLQANSGRLFALLYGPANARASVLIAPPFCEEMNRCRQTINRFARQAAREGIATLQLDLYGTGESEGEFGDASWKTWQDDLLCGLNFLHDQGLPKPSLLGIRGGCLLASELVRQQPDRLQHLLFWQPVPAGKSVVTELLRMRVAGGLTGNVSGPKLNELRAQLQVGEAVETGGYELADDLALPLESVNLKDLQPPLPNLDWLEISGSAAPVRPVAKAMIDGLNSAGASVTLHQIVDPSFWSTAETTVGKATIQASLELLAGHRHD
jgi:exosortase A-associated hydrolase 2